MMTHGEGDPEMSKNSFSFLLLIRNNRKQLFAGCRPATILKEVLYFQDCFFTDFLLTTASIAARNTFSQNKNVIEYLTCFDLHALIYLLWIFNFLHSVRWNFMLLFTEFYWLLKAKASVIPLMHQISFIEVVVRRYS